MEITEYSLAIGITFLWIGFVGAISFMEAWIKFRAPGITVPLGLGIGRLVFKALNRVESLFALILMICYFLFKERMDLTGSILYFVPTLLLILQTIWLLPALDVRAELHIQGLPVPHSKKLHLYYVGFEIIKVISLICSGILLFGVN